MINNKTVDIIVKYTDKPASHTITISADLGVVISNVYDIGNKLDPQFKKNLEDSANY